MGLGPADAIRIARAAFEASWCDDEKQRRLAEFDGWALALHSTLDPNP